MPSQGQDQVVQELVARIATLEKALEDQKQQHGLARVEPDCTSRNSPSGSSAFTSTDVISSSMSPSPNSRSFELRSVSQHEEDDKRDDRGALTPPLILLGSEVYATLTALAQLSFGHHGEFVGRGNLICALHSITSGPARFLYATSTNATSAYHDPTLGLSSITPAEREELIQSLPPRQVATTSIHSFFAHYNWRVGIPEQWFQSACAQMWAALEYPSHDVQINMNWLSLFFAILAVSASDSGDDSPQVDDSGDLEPTDKYFMCAMTARRIAEDDYLNKPNVSLMASAADGTVLGCLAIPLLCCYLAQRGRIGEAWKLVGTGVRNAESIGMHRDPEWSAWQVMSKDEIDLRRIAWWGLVFSDKLYSYLLGRPHMVRKDATDVAIPSPIEPDGSVNYWKRGLGFFIQLADIAAETIEKTFIAKDAGGSAVLFDLDDKYQQWEDNLPPEYQQNRDEHVIEGLDPAELILIDQQRYSLATWYLMCRMKLHLGAITGSNISLNPWADTKEKSKRCIILSMRQIRLQCDTHAAALQLREQGRPPFPGSHWFFEGCISLAEAAIVLLTVLARYPWEENLKEAVELIDGAMAVFTHVVSEQTGKQGEIARMATKVLGALREEDWWKSQVISASKYHSSTAPISSDAKAFEGFGSQWYSGNLPPSSFQSPQYTLSGIRDVTGGMGFAPEPSSSRSRRVSDIHMADLLEDS